MSICVQKINKTFLRLPLCLFGTLVFFAFIFEAQAQSTPLEACRKNINRIAKGYGLSSQANYSFNSLDSCYSYNKDLYDYSYLRKEGYDISKLGSCKSTGAGPLCSARSYTQDTVAFWSSRAKITSLVDEMLSDRQRLILTRNDSSVQKIAERTGERLSGMRYLRELAAFVTYNITDFAIRDFGIHKQDQVSFGIFDLKNKAKADLGRCVGAAVKVSEVKTCIFIYGNFFELSLGENLLTYFYNKYLEDAAKGNKGILEKAVARYKSCAVDYHQNPLNAENSTDKIKACVYSGLIYAFDKVVDVNLQERLSLSEANAFKAEAYRSCDKDQIIRRNSENMFSYMKLSTKEASDIEALLLSCNSEISSQAVRVVAKSQLRNSRELQTAYGDRVEEYAEIITNQSLAECKKRMPQIKSDQECEKFFLPTAAFTVFDKSISDMIASEAPGLSESAISEVRQRAEPQFRKCKDETYNHIVENPDASDEEIKSFASNCLKNPIYSISYGLHSKLLEKELAENETLKKHGVFFSKDKMHLESSKFVRCVKDETAHEISFDEMAGSFSSAIKNCELQSRKSLVAGSMDQVIGRELSRMGMESREVDQILADYKEQGESFYGKVKEAQDSQAVMSLIADAEPTIKRELAPYVIRKMVAEESGGLLGAAQQERVIQKTISYYSQCRETAEVCVAQAKEFGTRSAVDEVLPAMIYTEVQKQAGTIVSPAYLKRMGLQRVLAKGMSSAEGQRLKAYVASQYLRKVPMERIKQDQRVKMSVFKMLQADPAFMNSFSQVMVQTELNNKYKSLSGIERGFLARGSMDWRVIRNTQAGKQARQWILYSMQQTVVYGESKDRYMPQIRQAVEAAVKEYNFRTSEERRGELKRLAERGILL